MKTRGSFTGLGTLVALRTYLTFCLCAAVPIILAATLGNRIVSSSLREQAQSHLRDTSKAYGLLIFERLRLADELLSNLARAALRADAAGVQELRQFHSSHLRIVAIDLGAQNDATPGAAAAAGTVQGTLQSLTLQGQQVILTVTHQQGNRTAKIVASLDADYLWDADAVLATAMQVCILAERGQTVHCIGDALKGDAAVEARWSLFLPARYGSAAWQIRTRQSNAVVFTTLDTLRRTIAIVTAASVLIALLLSVIQIRRNHEPLTKLTMAARRMGRRRFDERLTIDTKDEYAKLGRAFNTMASSLSRQFLLLRTLGRVDRMILAEPSIEVLVKRILPSLPRLLESDSVVFALATDRGVTVHVARKGSPCVEVLSTNRPELSLCELEGRFSEPSAAFAARGWNEIATQMSSGNAMGLRVDVASKLRGVLLINEVERASGSTQLRHARLLARRFAIALGSEERRAALLRQAYYDTLTGLPNRQLFRDRLEHGLARAQQSGQPVALIYIDLDRFKNVNDSIGHSAGDELLRAVSERFSAQIASSDTLARLGGDEFVVIVSNHAHEPAHILVERLQASLAEPIAIQGSLSFACASFGIAIYPRDGGDAETLLRNADTAMYRAKSTGRGRMTYFEDAMNRDIQHRLLVEQRLRVALRDGTLRLAYQPKISLVDGALHGVEALARWTDAELGVVPPAVFIAVAEECGMIEQLGAWALREACTTYQRCLREGVDLHHVSVNASMRQLRDDRFLNDVEHALQISGIAASALEIEVTESMLAENPAAVAATLAHLRHLGIRIAIDDFGTGYSSMASLSTMPTDILKIDRSFVMGCHTGNAAASVVEAIISMAHVLGKTTVAEGVETEEQLKALQRLGCDSVQGYLLARPMSDSELSQLPSLVAGWRSLLSACEAQDQLTDRPLLQRA